MVHLVDSPALSVPPRRLRLDGWQVITAVVLDGIASPHTRRAYSQALEEFVIWYRDDPHREFNKATVQRYRTELENKGLAPSSINVRMSAIRRLASEAGDNDLLSPALVAGISRTKGAKRSGLRIGQWLTAEQAQRLLAVPDPSTIKGARDQAILSLLLGAGLRRAEVVALTVAHIQNREDRWLIVDLVGKHGRIRSVPIPDWAHATVVRWLNVAPTVSGPIFRPVTRYGLVEPGRLSSQAVFNIVREYSNKAGIPISPHDLRRSFAKLARHGNAPLEQIQLSLGHASVVTTELYLGTKQNLRDAPCDRLGIHVRTDTATP